MTTTELIDLLKKHEFGGATGKPREISFDFRGIFIPTPSIVVDSTGDGLITEICLGLDTGKLKTDTDVAPVKHGRWFLDGDYEYINCSACLYPLYMGFDTTSDAKQYLETGNKLRYCPNCGAKMDGDGDV